MRSFHQGFALTRLLGSLTLLASLPAEPAFAAPLVSMPCDDMAPMHTWNQPATTDGTAELGQRSPTRKKVALMALREEGRELQDKDGGRLSQSHRAYLQAKLDAIQNGDY
jgi:hypothetical protein